MLNLADRELEMLVKELGPLAEKYENMFAPGVWPERDYAIACHRKDAANFRALASAIRENRVKIEEGV